MFFLVNENCYYYRILIFINKYKFFEFFIRRLDIFQGWVQFGQIYFYGVFFVYISQLDGSFKIENGNVVMW